MIDATAEGEEEEGLKNKLTDIQIIGNAITFMLAGYETTATSLSYTSYLLAINPHVQEKLQEEIDTYMEENPVMPLPPPPPPPPPSSLLVYYIVIGSFSLSSSSGLELSGHGYTGITPSLPSSTSVTNCINC